MHPLPDEDFAPPWEGFSLSHWKSLIRSAKAIAISLGHVYEIVSCASQHVALIGSAAPESIRKRLFVYARA